jgi:hypothetical protein
VPLIQTFHRVLARVTEPQVLFTLVGVFLLTVIWATTLGVVKVKHSDAQHAAAVSSREILGTYEAQIVRSLREIDQTLNLVEYWHERDGGTRALSELRDKQLLPPDLIFVVSIADRRGNIVASTRPSTDQSVADQDYFRQQIDSNRFFIGMLPRAKNGEANLHFSRRLQVNGVFDGVVIVAVDAAYFVSGYEAPEPVQQTTGSKYQRGASLRWETGRRISRPRSL